MASLIVLRFGLVGCQRAPHYPVRDVPDGGFGSVHVAIGSDDCRVVVLTASPWAARIGEHLDVSVHVTDADPSSSMTYTWTATAGAFSDPASAATTFNCPGRDRAGPQTITVAVSDGSCVAQQMVRVFCYALADGGGPATTDQPDGDLDAGANCAQGDPTTCEGDQCNQCTDDNCDTLAHATAVGGIPSVGCDIYVDEDQQARCQRLYACMRDSRCVQNSDPRRCWCGSVDLEACAVSGGAVANGPCLQQVIAAAGTNDPALIDTRSIDSSFPIGGAIKLATCRSTYCSNLSDPPNPVCGL